MICSEYACVCGTVCYRGSQVFRINWNEWKQQAFITHHLRFYNLCLNRLNCRWWSPSVFTHSLIVLHTKFNYRLFGTSAQRQHAYVALTFRPRSLFMLVLVRYHKQINNVINCNSSLNTHTHAIARIGLVSACCRLFSI